MCVFRGKNSFLQFVVVKTILRHILDGFIDVVSMCVQTGVIRLILALFNGAAIGVSENGTA